MNIEQTIASAPQPSAEPAICKMCTIRLEKLCYQRAWWFRIFRETLATGVRIFALIYLIQPKGYEARSRMCHSCVRFKKQGVQARSGLFRWLDGYVNPFFNRMRDSLLTADELQQMRELAQRAADRDFREP
jgi:hypothetical protein